MKQGRFAWRPPADDFEERLVTGPGEALPCRCWLLAVLFAVTFLPRFLFALQWEPLSTDSVTFNNASLALAAADYEQAFRDVGLNIYPMILWALRATGLQWELAAEGWSLLMASAAVLPLFGWVRRQFDDQVATVACLLYAVHAKLIAMSCLVIRDPTFWFLFLLTLYLVWRAVVEVRWRFFVMAGLGLTLVGHLRTEGWLLVVPCLLWPMARWHAAEGRRTRLVLGTLLTLAIVPIALTVLNVTWLREAPQWSLLRRDHAEILQQWLSGGSGESAASTDDAMVAGPAAAPVDAAVDFDTVAIAPTTSPIVKSRKLAVQLVKVFTYPLGLLAIFGTIAYGHVYRRREHLVLLITALVLMAAIWIRSAEHRNDPRYFMPIILTSLPWMSLGFLAISGRVFRLVDHRPWATPARRRAIEAVLILAVLVPSGCDVKLSWGRFMIEHADLGRWMQHQYGPDRTMASNTIDMRLVEYYSHAQVAGLFRALGSPPDILPPAIAGRPDFVLIWAEGSDEGLAEFRDFADRVVRLTDGQYRRVPAKSLPPHWIVLVRTGMEKAHP